MDSSASEISIDNIMSRLNAESPETAAQIGKYLDAANRKQKALESELENTRQRLQLYEDMAINSGVCTLVISRGKGKSTNLFDFTILFANAAVESIFGVTSDKCVKHQLKEYFADYEPIEMPNSIDSNFCQKNMVDKDEQHFTFHLYGQKDGSAICFIKSTNEIVKLREQMNTNLRRHELIIESLDFENSDITYSNFFVKILERIGFHMNPKRLFIFMDDETKGKSNLTYQWSAEGVKKLPINSTIDHRTNPSWNKTLNEQKMIIAAPDAELNDDIRHVIKLLELENACIFPLIANDELCGSFVFETTSNHVSDNLEISYIKILSILISQHINRRIIADTLKREKEHAQEADRLKSAFLVNMSHDIRIPLNSILGFSDLLADPDLTETEREEFISLIDKSGRDLISLVDNIIDMSKIETGQMNIKIEMCKLKPLLNDIMATYNHHPKFEEHSDLSLQLDFAERFNQLSIKTDIFRFRQICIHLIDNAIQFTDSGTIKFGVSNAWDNTIEFYVQDTGIGIPEEAQNVIFQNFCKVNRTSKEYTGTGLGLPISKRLIEMLGGSIRVVSVPGKGSTFYFTHPLPEKVPESLNNLHEIKSLFNWKGRSIAIADNIEQDRKYMEYILNNTGIDIIWLNSDLEVFEYFKKGNKADVMLMELRMASVNDIEPVMRIHDIVPIPIIALTTNTNTNESRTLAEKAGCADVISKPLNMSNLLNIINRVMKSPEDDA